MKPPRRTRTIRRRLARAMTALVLGITLTMTTAAVVLLGWPNLKKLARIQTNLLATRIESRLLRLGQDTERLLGTAADWLEGTDLILDHPNLNRRFMPLLARFPEIVTLRVAEPGGSEWMLFRKSDGTWLNRLSSPQDRDGTRRFLHWSATGSLERDERLSSNYDPRQLPWLPQVLEGPEGQTWWSHIQRLTGTGGPGITAVRRVRVDGGHDLVVALDLELTDVARVLLRYRPPGQAFAVVLSEDGRVLGLSASAEEEVGALHKDLLLQPVIGKQIGPLQQGIRLWLSRGEQPLGDQPILHHGEPWQVGFRRLKLGGGSVWLGVFLPWNEVFPSIFRHLALLGLLLLLSLGVGLLLARRLASVLDRPLESLVMQNRRIGELDFEPPSPLASDLYEIRELAHAQDEMRARLASRLAGHGGETETGG
jgi:hypothetical protein